MNWSLSQPMFDTLWTGGIFGVLILAAVVMWYFGVWKNHK